MFNRWKKLVINGCECAVLCFDTRSDYGIDKGRISKLEIRKDGKTLARYDRGWDMAPSGAEVTAAYENLLKDYN